MSFLNVVNLIGYLGQDPEVKYMPSGKAVTTLSIATTETWKDKETGKKSEETQWHRVVYYGALAEIICDKLRKGSQLHVTGTLKYKSWDVEGVKKYSTQIDGKDFIMLGTKASTNTAGTSNSNPASVNFDELFTPVEIEALHKNLPVKVSNDDPKKSEKLKILKGDYGYTWKATAKEWSPKAKKSA